MALDERAFFTEKPETRPGRFTCPKCNSKKVEQQMAAFFAVSAKKS